MPEIAKQGKRTDCLSRSCCYNKAFGSQRWSSSIQKERIILLWTNKRHAYWSYRWLDVPKVLCEKPREWWTACYQQLKNGFAWFPTPDFCCSLSLSGKMNDLVQREVNVNWSPRSVTKCTWLYIHLVEGHSHLFEESTSRRQSLDLYHTWISHLPYNACPLASWR